MRVTWTEIKRAKTLQERGLDFARAGEVFADLHLPARRTTAKVARRGLLRQVFSTAAWSSWSGRRAATRGT
jgi:uncharacterized DUF497 family protein